MLQHGCARHLKFLLLLLLQGLGDAAELLSRMSERSLQDNQNGHQLLQLLEAAEEAINGHTAWDE
jgi:hypothetical protein